MEVLDIETECDIDVICSEDYNLLAFLQYFNLILSKKICSCGEICLIYKRCSTFYFTCNKFSCRKQYTVSPKGFLFAQSRLPYEKGLRLMYFFTADNTLTQVCQNLGISSKTGVEWFNFCREVCVLYFINNSEKIGGRDKIVEIDELVFGKSKYNKGKYVQGQQVLVGVERESNKCFLVPLPNRNSETLSSIIQAYVKQGSTVSTDSWKGYKDLQNLHYQYLTVNHSLHFKDSNMDVHAKKIEGIWTLVKRTIPTRGRCKENLVGYLAQYLFFRKYKDDRFIDFMKAIQSNYINSDLIVKDVEVDVKEEEIDLTEDHFSDEDVEEQFPENNSQTVTTSANEIFIKEEPMEAVPGESENLVMTYETTFASANEKVIKEEPKESAPAIGMSFTQFKESLNLADGFEREGNVMETLVNNTCQEEKVSTSKSDLRSGPETSGVYEQIINASICENLCCIFCKRSFKNKDELRSHMTSHEKEFKCPQCNYESNRKDSLKRHLQIHRDVKLYKCSMCNYECNHKGSFKTHILKHDNIKLFKCLECTYECYQKGDLQKHLLIHANVKLFKCSECNYECNQKGSLRIHLLNHSNVKLFKCSECDYKCNHKGSLKVHMLNHANIKLFKCTECNYGCNHKDSLKIHMLNHANIKLYKCSECSYECNHKGRLRQHMLTHRNTKLYKCSECNFGCNRKGYLREHMIKHNDPLQIISESNIQTEVTN